MEEAPLRVMVVDDNAMVRQALCNILRQEPGIDVVAEASNGSDGVRLARELRPDLVLMDITLPTVNGFDATRLIKNDLPDTPILIVSQFDSPAFMRESLAAGASGFIAKHDASLHLIPAIRKLRPFSRAANRSA